MAHPAITRIGADNKGVIVCPMDCDTNLSLMDRPRRFHSQALLVMGDEPGTVLHCCHCCAQVIKSLMETAPMDGHHSLQRFSLCRLGGGPGFCAMPVLTGGAAFVLAAFFNRGIEYFHSMKLHCLVPCIGMFSKRPESLARQALWFSEA